MAIDTKALALQVEAMQTIYSTPVEVVAKLAELLRHYFAMIDDPARTEPGAQLAMENTLRMVVGSKPNLGGVPRG